MKIYRTTLVKCHMNLRTTIHRCKFFFFSIGLYVEPIMEILYRAKIGVHAFGYNTAAGKPIWMKSGALWAALGAGAGPGRFWARPAHYRKFEKQPQRLQIEGNLLPNWPSTGPAFVAEWLTHSAAMCSRAWRTQWPEFDSARARPPTKKLFLMIPMHMINRELIPGR